MIWHVLDYETRALTPQAAKVLMLICSVISVSVILFSIVEAAV